jgi:hypothetical protein
MLKRIRRLPSPALVISAIALVVAIGGGTYAIAALNSAKVKKIARKQADREIKRKAAGLSVAHAASADNATHAASADNATNATTAATATVATTADTATNATHATNADHADAAGNAYSAFHDAPIILPDTLEATGNPIATLSVPQAGSYVINAKFLGFNGSPTADLTSAECKLAAEGDVDTMTFDETTEANGNEEPVAMQLIHTFSSPGSVTLACSDFGNGHGSAQFTRITAFQVAQVTNTGF